MNFSNFPDAGDSPEKRHFRNLGKPAEDGECDPNNPDFFKYSPKDPVFRKSTRDHYKKQFCEHLCRHLEVGNLIAAGIPDGTSINQCPEIIPEKLFLQFHMNPNYEYWDQDIFAGHTGKYTNVRIINPRVPAENLISPTSETPGGRPTKKELIEATYRNCKSAGLINFKGSQIDAVKAVRAYIQEAMPEDWNDGIGLSEKAVGNHIRDAFNADKSQSSKN